MYRHVITLLSYLLPTASAFVARRFPLPLCFPVFFILPLFTQARLPVTSQSKANSDTELFHLADLKCMGFPSLILTAGGTKRNGCQWRSWLLITRVQPPGYLSTC